MLVPGASMMSEQECSKQLKKPILNKKGKQLKDKNGDLMWETTIVPDFTKYDKHTIKVSLDKKKPVTYTYHTRKCKQAKQVINISQEAYNYFISNEVPYEYKASQSWKSISKKQRLEWYLKSICESRGGILQSYTVFDD